ncbi:PP2C family protein-serine/threonine phosphatase [Actinacidiphila bryophytorum]|uniref:Serine phosphatase RsbU, regulator of sigma subunit n=1 Tax=Actinacidiphila bryophytorum TaxID=1436133 RepID=A0A9W4GVQ6_9ACTN|nr:SpoIIE family protein phosphatase [Actinacidiphila bryophytorum]MBM9438974.1 SpoIIE family protein phosphatase [Actinacidiphila bryophytorum]MBN6544600.1 SpoIIE family protein phosphatase [Actinacidiphila bryophytorum]CAG7596589.1 Serine phosphatase RsbU, regulator of sigma subunit [Actinacidiphila bryophytorum]
MAEEGTQPEIDYRAVYKRLPAGIALLTPELCFADANDAYVLLSGRSLDDLTGRYIFDVFPDSPQRADTANGPTSLGASLRHVLATRERDSLALQRYDVELPDRPGTFEERYWSTINTPILDAAGEVVLIAHRVEEVTAFMRAQSGGRPDDAKLRAELYMRARELQEVNARMREAHAREREVALTLQAALLPAPRPVGHRAAVRYQPAVSALNVCGDWYDLVELPGDRASVAVGDVVGHGLSAASVMGQLRSALSAAARVTSGPAEALDALGLYARSVEGAESTTVVKAFIDWPERTITYSNAGHPPAALLHPDGSVQFLDQATDPPLGARPDHQPRPQATVDFTAGSTLVLYTDGLIERRHEDIDVGLARLASALRHRALFDPESLADTLLAELIPPTGATDDTALVVLRL